MSELEELEAKIEAELDNSEQILELIKASKRTRIKNLLRGANMSLEWVISELRKGKPK